MFPALHKKSSFFILAAIVLALAVGGYFLLSGKRSISIKPVINIVSNNTTTPEAIPKEVPPNISLEIQKGKKTNYAVVRWGNLPEGTTKLDVFISKTGTNKWSLWQTIGVSQDELGGGSASFAINSTIANGNYSFYAEAQSGGGNSGSPLWTSSSTNPTYTTSTQTGATPPPASPPPASPPPASTQPPPSPTPSSTPGSSPTSSGTVYYTPSGGISGTQNPQTANFWVQHVNNNSLEIGWQNIPSDADEVTIYRSQSSNGTWLQILDQPNPAVSYSIGLVDNTLHDTYYYKLDIFRGGSQIAEYGPIELLPL